MATVNQYKGTYAASKTYKSVVAETIVEAATLLTLPEGEPDIIQLIQSNMDYTKPKDDIIFETESSPAEGGSTYPATFTVKDGAEVILSAVPALGYAFVKWQKDGVDIAASTATMSVVVTGVRPVYTAIFE